ncbi:MAG: hypothetical protein A3C53_03040 [Omnitrophica WOR_2 bacterium RIFCSPHIGHO2_02_FULL_68_15]|nr:MAG: hypothetical protein A3C53_03040 [Omnitrophica WOR_2 bacterium RIFCSPHIGHO2_02_FULL_68_15]
MPLSRWMGLIGIVVALGCLKVSQHNALYVKGYAVGKRLAQVHQQETDLSWLRAQVTGLESPGRLARAAQDRQLKLVAWSTLSPERAFAAVRAAESEAMAEGLGGVEPRLDHVAALDPDRQDSAGDTAD